MRPEADTVARPADVCFLLEGTYPYIRGGVSSWVHQMLTEAPDLSFAIFFIGSQRAEAKEFAYEIPANVVRIEEVFLYDQFPQEEMERPSVARGELEKLFAVQKAIYLETDRAQRVRRLQAWMAALDQAPFRLTFGHLTRSEEAWDMIREIVQRYLPEDPFTAIYYTWVYLHAPIWKLLLMRQRIPPARVYHSLCTGYAGLAGSVAARARGAPFLLSEHGIYVKERIEEINQARWIHESSDRFLRVDAGMSPLKRAWVEMFILLGRVAYEQAAAVTTLFSRNGKMQTELGCPADKLRVIPNGVNPLPYEGAFARRAARLSREKPRTVGFIGRVVSIKDVKTLIRAMAIARESIPDIHLQLIGPTGEEPEYFAECLSLLKLLRIEKWVTIAGRQNVLEVIAGIDVMVLTSISEGLPFVILEGYAAGIPTVATDVGCCRELIFGDSPEDKALGPSGVLTRIGEPDATARGLVELFGDPEKLRAMGEVGLERLRRFYLEADVMERFRGAYRALAEGREVF